jgi:hypothetical protein
LATLGSMAVVRLDYATAMEMAQRRRDRKKYVSKMVITKVSRVNSLQEEQPLLSMRTQNCCSTLNSHLSLVASAAFIFGIATENRQQQQQLE